MQIHPLDSLSARITFSQTERLAHATVHKLDRRGPAQGVPQDLLCSTPNIPTLYALAARPQGIEYKTAKEAVDLMKSLWELVCDVVAFFDDAEAESLRQLLNNGKKRLEDIAKDDARLSRFMQAVENLKADVASVSVPRTLYDTLAELDSIAEALPACDAITAELRAARFRVTQRVSQIFADQRQNLEEELSLAGVASDTFVEALRKDLDSATAAGQLPRAARIQSTIDRAVERLGSFRDRCSNVVESMQADTQSEKESAYQAAQALRSTLRLERNQARAAYEKLETTKTKVRQPKTGSTSTTWTRPHSDRS